MNTKKYNLYKISYMNHKINFMYLKKEVLFIFSTKDHLSAKSFQSQFASFIVVFRSSLNVVKNF